MKRTELKRSTPLRAKKYWNPPRKALPTSNPKATAKRSKRRSKEKHSEETKAVMAQAWIDANGFCQECKGTFDMDDRFSDAAPEFDHSCYKKGRVAGRYLHRKCHHAIEMSQHPTRHTNRNSAGRNAA